MGKRAIPVLAAAWVLTGGMMPAAGGDGPLCDRAASLVPGLVCVESARGLAMAGSRERAEHLLGLAEAGADRFVTHFGSEPLRYAVVEGRDTITPRETIEALRKSGFPVVLPWLSEKVFREQTELSLRRAIEAQMAGQPQEQIDAAVATALARQTDPARRQRIELAAVSHELGHDWFRIGYWPDAPLGEDKHYGGPSPDWLDEMAAVLMEAPSSFEDRVTQFRQRFDTYRADPAKADANTRLLVDLPNFLTEVHPASAQVRLLNEQRTAEEKQSAVRLITGEEARKIAEGGARFYLQSAVVSQYLVARTGDPKVFGRIAQAFVRGETIEQWLANDEPKGTLPRDMAAMQADWLVWLESRFPRG
ncbi:hypothetical protein [Erythrobacter oryzae]|uniref:hypothetical protein n=1 Tax=Erythrobacter oryzae TaxID=3019556 RepID=UPI0025526E2C|nr:hypothetical protein [Erythrobacter sp. COR-2]